MMALINTSKTATIKYGYEKITTLGDTWPQYIKCKSNAYTTNFDSSSTASDSLWLDYGCTATGENVKMLKAFLWSVDNCATATGNIYRQWTYDYEENYHTRLRTPQDRLREIIQQRQSPAVIGTRKFLTLVQDPRELRARETLRRVLGDEKFRRFIKNGFTTVRARSGLVYQIFPGHGITNVYRDGQKVERLCVVLRGDFPPTDSLIMRYLLILNDEQDFRSHAVKHTVYPANMTATPPRGQESLPEVFRRLKVA